MFNYLVEGFCDQFIKEVKNLKESFKQVGIDIDKALPIPFRGNEQISQQVFYSVDKKQLVINFAKSKQAMFAFLPVQGNAFPGDIFTFEGENVESTISGGGKFISGDQSWRIDYAFIFSELKFMKRLRNVKELAREFVSVYWSFFVATKNKTKEDYLFQLENIRLKMADLFFDESVGELVLDKFLELNPIVLEQGLSLYRPMHQVVLKNVLDIYEHDLKPDLIAFDESAGRWTIIDYKKAKRNIIKNYEKVRTGFKAEVHALEDQLRDYMEYFEEREHREYVKKKYKVEIEHPKAIGIIGNVEDNQQSAFNRLIDDKPRWLNIVPYNYLYNNFCRHIELVARLLAVK